MQPTCMDRKLVTGPWEWKGQEGGLAGLQRGPQKYLGVMDGLTDCGESFMGETHKLKLIKL